MSTQTVDPEFSGPLSMFAETTRKEPLPMTDCRIHITANPTQMMLDEIDAFQQDAPSQAIHQSLVWPTLNRPEVNLEYMHFIAKVGPRVLAGGLIRLRKVAAGFTVATIQRGPVTPDPYDVKTVLLAMEEKLIELGVITLSVNPSWAGAERNTAIAALEGAGYQRVAPNLQDFPTSTALIDIARSEQDMLTGMTKDGRSALRQAVHDGVNCRPMASFEEALRANEIMVGMAAETGLVLDSQHNFVAHYEHLKTAPKTGSILVAELNGEIFGAAVSYLEGNVGHNTLLTTSSAVEAPGAYALVWDSMMAMKRLGATVFDMGGFPDDDMENAKGMESRGAFKQSFGPNVVKLTPLMSKPLRPLLHGAVTKLRGVHRKHVANKASR